MTFERSQLLVMLKAHCLASYLCVGLICAFWMAIGGADWGTVAWLLPFAPIVFPFLSLLAVMSMVTGSLGSLELAWPAAAVLYVPVFYVFRRVLISRSAV